MKTLSLIALLWLSLCAPAKADYLLTHIGTAPGVAASYVGPGDVVAGATWYHSCTRAYTAAYAAGGGNACTIKRASDSAACTFVFASSGSPNLAATPCTGTSGTCTGGSAPCTISTSCNSDTCGIVDQFDQTGNGIDVLQADLFNGPVFTAAVINGKPCAVYNGSVPQYLGSTANVPSSSASITFGAVGERSSNFTSQQGIFAVQPNLNDFFWYPAANTGGVYFNGNATWPFSDSTFHAFSVVQPSGGGTPSVNVDGSYPSVTGTTLPITFGGGTVSVGALDSGGGEPLYGDLCEDVAWESGLTTTQQNALHANWSAFYGTP